jgi:5-hydroxyisourate hydrolase
VLSSIADSVRTKIASGVTDADGRLKDLLSAAQALDATVYELVFETGVYFSAHGIQPFHPRVSVIFEITDSRQHYHVPLLISPYGYTTYRGS